AIESKLGLHPEKLSTARHVFAESGNMQSATVYFVMDEVRKRSAVEGRATTGDGLQLGGALWVWTGAQHRDCRAPQRTTLGRGAGVGYFREQRQWEYWYVHVIKTGHFPSIISLA
ncbi:hypothetical protein BHM03_00055289, partial [Ensete ventricosum]